MHPNEAIDDTMKLMCLSISKIRMWPWTKIGVIFSILFSTGTFCWGLKQYEEINRPYIGIDDAKIDVTIDYEGTNQNGTRINPAHIIPVIIRNYGKLPAFFTASYISEYNGQVKPFQVATNYILPDQTIELQWAESLPTKIDDNDVCKAFEKMRVIISYGKINYRQEYVTTASPKMLDLPLNSKSSREKYSGWCWYDQEKGHKYVYDWSIDEMQ